MTEGSGLDIFISYAHKDESLLRDLETHLALLQRQGLVRTWHDRKIQPGEEWAGRIDGQLAAAEVVLLLISPDFLASDYCWEVEMRQALARHDAGEARVVPVILRPCDWQGAPFGRLQALPKDARPVVAWTLADEAWLEVTRGVRAVIESRGTADSEPAASRETGGDDRDLSRRLESLYEHREQLTLDDADTRVLDGEILDVRRLLRKGPQLRSGEFLADGRFKLGEPLGQGGFATVWKAYDRKLRQPVAVKVLHGHHSADLSKRERFFRGARKMSELAHPHVVRVLERQLEDDGWCFFVMEHAAGGDFQRAVLAGSLTMEQKLAIVLQAGEALEAAHREGIVHRDVKPSNILLDGEGEAKLTDFDLVRAEDTTGFTATRALMGTLLFAAPEALAAPKEVTAAADVYSLGSTAVFALRGEPLPRDYYRDSSGAVAALPVSEALREMLSRATAPEVAQRYTTMAEFCGALAAAPHVGKRVAPAAVVPAVAPALGEAVSPPAVAHRRTADPVLGIEFVDVEPGEFVMGSPENEAGRYGDERQHPVKLSQGFRMATTPVTRNHFEMFVEATSYRTEAEREGWSYVWDGSEWQKQKGTSWRDSGGSGLPVVHVSWNDAQELCKWLSGQAEGRFRLPTEAEWEYAARAGTDTAIYAPRLDDIAWYEANSGGSAHPVGGKAPNAWGLYDMLGNVWEWAADWFEAEYPEGPVTDPTGPARGSYRVVRGGSWFSHARYCRAADRGRSTPGNRYDDVGFRLVRTDA